MSADKQRTDYFAVLDESPDIDTTYRQDEDYDELVRVLKDRFQKAKEARYSYERDWELYRLYLKGEQNLYRNRDTNEVVRVSNEDSKRLKSVRNVLRPTARSLLGKLTRTIPTCTVIPATADYDEQQGARVATALLAWARRKENLDVKYVQINEFLPWAGNGVIQLRWAPDKGRRLAYCLTCNFSTTNLDMVGQTCPRCAEQRRAELETQKVQHQQNKMMAFSSAMQSLPPGVEPPPQEAMEEITQDTPVPPISQAGPLSIEQEPPSLEEGYDGDFEVIVRDIRDFYVEPGAEHISGAQWVCLRSAVSVAEARRMFPMYADIISKEDDLYIDRTANIRYNAIDSYGSMQYLTDHCYLYEFHERPSGNYPDGRIVFMCNDKIVGVEYESYWKILNRHPFYMFGFDHNPGEFWCESFLVQAWSRQKEINLLETQIREHTELALKPKMLNPMGSRISQDEITAASDQIIKYSPSAGQPSFLVWPQLSQQVFGRRDELVDDIRLQACVTQQEAGVSTSDPNGRAMAIIEAEADQQIGPILVRNHAEWRELHRGILQIFQAYAHPEVKWAVPGPEGVFVYSFDELTLSPGWDVQLETEDGLSRNPAVRLQQALDLMNAGVFMDPRTGQPNVKEFMQRAKLNLPKTGYDMQATERAAAAQIPYNLEKGKQWQPQPEDDPAIFAEELLGWLRGKGRKRNDAIQQQVRQIWQFYAMWALNGSPPGQPGQQQQQQQGGAGQGGPDMTARGGSANNAGHMQSDVASQARQQVSNADRQAEGQARVQQNREG